MQIHSILLHFCSPLTAHMKKIGLFAAIIAVALLFQASVISAQRRPVRKPATTTTPAQPVAKPTPKTASPAEEFFNQGLKCEAKDNDCQVSNYTKAINLHLNTKAVYQKRAAAYLGREDFEKAIADLTKVIELDPNDANGFKDRAKAFLGIRRNSQNIQNAIKDFSSAIDLEPKDAEAYGIRGEAYAGLGLSEKANADFEKALSLKPADAQVLLNQGKFYFNSNDLDKAVELFSKVIQLVPSAEAYEKRGIAYLRQKKIDAALQDITQAVALDVKRSKLFSEIEDYFERTGQMDDALRVYDRMILKDSKSPELFYKRALIHFQKKDYKSVTLDLSKALELNDKYAKAYELKCNVEFKFEDYETAYDDCSKAIVLDQTLDEAFLNRYKSAELLEMTPDPKDLGTGLANTLTNANKILERNPRDYSALMKRASYFSLIHNFQAALSDYNKAIEVEPNSAEAYSGRGLIYKGYTPAFKSFPAAEADFTKALELNPNDEENYLRKAEVMDVILNENKITVLQRGVSAYNEAQRLHFDGLNSQIEVVTRGLEELPTSIPLLNYRAKSYLSLNLIVYEPTYAKAAPNALQNSINDYKKVIEIYLRDKKTSNNVLFIEATNGLATAYKNSGDVNRAIAVWAKGIEALPDSPRAYHARGAFYNIYLNDKAKAAADFTKGSEVGTDALYQKYNRDALVSLDQQKANELKYAAERRARENEQKRKARIAAFNAILGVTATVVETVANNRQSPSSGATSESPTQTTARPGNSSANTGDLSNGGTSSNKQWGPWTTSSCYSSIQLSVISDGPVPGDPGKFYWRVRARSLAGKPAFVAVAYGDSQQESDYAATHGGQNSRGETRMTSGIAYRETDRAKQNLPQVDIRNNSNIFVRIARLAWQDPVSGQLGPDVPCGR